MNTADNQILKQDALGRISIPKDQREQLLDTFEAGAMSGKAFAKQHGINYQTFASWIQKRRRARGDYENEDTRRQLRMGKKKISAPIKSSTPPMALNFIEAEFTTPPDTSLSAVLEVLLPGGVVVKLTSESQLPLLTSLLRELSC